MNFFIEVVLLSIPKQSRRVNKQTNKQTATCLVFLFFFFPPSFFRKPYSFFPSRTHFFFRQCSNMMEVSDVVLHHPPHIKSDQERTLKKYSLYLCLYLSHFILLFLSLLKLIW